MLDENLMIARRSDVLWRSIAGYLVVATVDDAVHEATGPAPEIWRAIERPISIGELISSLAQEYAVAPEEIRHDVITFLDELVATGSVITHG